MKVATFAYAHTSTQEVSYPNGERWQNPDQQVDEGTGNKRERSSFAQKQEQVVSVLFSGLWLISEREDAAGRPEAMWTNWGGGNIIRCGLGAPVRQDSTHTVFM